MKFFNLKFLHHNHAGFTIIEVMVALAIMSIISLGASVSTAQLMNQTSRDTDYTSASRHSMNALHWISRDVIMAQKIEGYEGFPTSPLCLSWTSWDNKNYSAAYTVTDGVLERTYSDGVNVTTTRIAEYINTGEDMTYCTYDDGTVTVTVTSTVGKGDHIINVTKTRIITNRPGL